MKRPAATVVATGERIPKTSARQSSTPLATANQSVDRPTRPSWTHFHARPQVDLVGELPAAVLRKLALGGEQ
jgi:hypothetical protein